MKITIDLEKTPTEPFAAVSIGQGARRGSAKISLNNFVVLKSSNMTASDLAEAEKLIYPLRSAALAYKGPRHR